MCQTLSVIFYLLYKLTGYIGNGIVISQYLLWSLGVALYSPNFISAQNQSQLFVQCTQYKVRDIFLQNMHNNMQNNIHNNMHNNIIII